MKKPQVFLNERILKFREILVIDSDGQSLGVMQTREALNIAKKQGLDLFLVSQTVTPHVCKIVDYGHLAYEEAKRNRANHKAKQETKEIKISPRIQQHDLDTFTKRAIKFLEHGDKVKISCVFKAREIEHPELGIEKIQKMLEKLTNISTLENEIALAGKVMSVLIAPNKKP